MNTMRKNFCLIAIFLFTAHLTYAQQIICQWNFNTPLPTDNNILTGTMSASMGTGLARLVGGTTLSVGNPFNEGNDNDYFSTSWDNSGMNVTNYPAQATGNKTAGVLFPCNTTGYQNIKFRFEEKHSASSANYTVVQYNLDTLIAGGWTDVQAFVIFSSSYSTNWFTRIVDLSGIANISNQPRFAVRMVAAFAPLSGGNYISTLDQTASTYIAAGATIRYDMVSFSGTPITGCNFPSTQASDPVLTNSTSNQIDFSFQRGSGDSVLVLCREGSAVNQYPQTGWVYEADGQFGAGNQVGNGNYVVYKSAQTGRNFVHITGLTTGKVYHFSIFEFSGQNCYKTLPLYFHYTAGGTVFKPGELLLLGFDTNIPGSTPGNDKHYLTSLVDILPGTQFNLTSSRYEAGDSPYVRSNRWYNSGDQVYKDLDVQEFTYLGNVQIPAGAIIGIQNKFNSPTNTYDSITINGVYQPAFFSDSKKGGFTLATKTTKGEQLFLTQGSYYPIGEVYTNRYNLLFGHVLFGLSIYTDWVPISASPGTASSGVAYRSSRVPPEIECLHIANLSDTVGAAYFSGLKTGTKKTLKNNLSNPLNWNWKSGDTLLNITQMYVSPYTAEVGMPITITTGSATDASWTGEVDTDWFKCENWEGRFVPDAFSDVIIPSGLLRYPVLTKTASCRSISCQLSASLKVKAGARLEVGKGY